MYKSLKINVLALAMTLAAGNVGAAGLGRLSVMSALGQPLKAEIELLAVQPEEAATLAAKLASPEAFRQARLDRADVLGNVQLSVEQRPGGQPVLRITSTQNVNDPFLDLLIELNWSSGRILREYTVLLDPPSQQPPAQPAAAPVKPATSAPTTRTETPPPAQPKPAAEAEPTPAKESKPAPGKEGSAGKTTYGPVKSGETLRGIAGKVKHPDVTIDMMIAGLYQANKKSFLHENMNLLRKGQTLSIPEQDAVAHMFSPKQARDLIRDHGQAWNTYRGQIADMATKKEPEPTPAKEAKDAGAKGKVVPVPEKAKPAPAPAQPADVLKLSKGQPGADAKARERQQALEEEVAAKGRSLKEANERVAQLEKSVNDMQKLIKMKDQQAKVAPAPAAPAAKPAEAPKPAPAPTPAPAPAPAAEAPVTVPTPPTAPEEPGFLASLMEKPLYIGGALAAVLLAALGWMTLSRRRHRNLAQLEQNVINSGDDFKTAIFRTTAGATTQAPTTQHTSVMTDFSRLGLGAIDTHEVDPIAEAEVYMAYGRDAQAEEILKEALNKDPGRHEIALKLLEIYATRHDTVAFETQASEVYAALAGQATPLWAKITELGRSIDPDNPLYQFSGPTSYPEAPEPEAYRPGADVLHEPAPADVFEGSLDDLRDIDKKDEESAKLDSLFTDEPLPPLDDNMGQAGKIEDDDGVIDFQLDLDKHESDFIESAAVPTPLNPFHSATPEAMPSTDADFPMGDLSEFSLTDEQAEAEMAKIAESAEPVAEAAASSLPDLDFSGIDLELSEPMAEAPRIDEIDVGPAPSPDAEAPHDLGGDDEAIDPEIWEEVNTKLDLAKAYLEMGEREGAREILDEVINEGDRQQKALASELLASTS